MQNKVQILSTKKLSGSFITPAAENNIDVDEVSFIETKEIISATIKNRIEELSSRNIIALFTSSNAVDAVGKIVSAETNWKIFCIEPTTRKRVENIFINSAVAGAAKDAAELSEKIINDKSVKQVVFFCGNQRRDLLPSQLKKNGIDVEELIVYTTIEKPQAVTKKYDGILFFSPSAVRSFFQKNKINAETILFAIGQTTARELRNYSNNTTVISEIPDTEKVIADVIKYFSTIKTN
jgi:uroporphyrinogen-III synthase